MMLFLFNNMKIGRYIVNHSLFKFSTDTLNVRIPLKDPVTEKDTDEYIDRYQNYLFNAYLYKRKITRSEVWPKIHITDNIPEKEEPHLKYQNLYSLKKGLDEKLMKAIVENDPSKIDSAFIISVFNEDFFKEMMDQYLGKVLVCGKCPQNEQMEEVERKVVDLYRIFYFGQKISQFERQIQVGYLAQKQKKFYEYEVAPNNAYNRCNWRYSDQKLLEDMVNWPQYDMNLTDMGYRPFFQPMRILQRYPSVSKMFNALNPNFFERMHFKNTVRPEYMVTKQYLRWIADKLFSRTLHYVKSLQFTQNMKIPPDFLIENGIFNIHIWLIIDRLKQIDNRNTRFIIEVLKTTYHSYIHQIVGSMNLKRLNIMKKVINDMIAINNDALSMHFKGYKTSQKDPYFAIDALVWGIVFREKSERYGPEVYLFSEYLIKNYQHLRKYSEKDIINCLVEFDVFLVEPRYEQKIKQINPPLSEEQFQKQFDSDNPDKRYYYKTFQKGVNFDLDPNLSKPKEEYKFFSLQKIFQNLQRIYKKYFVSLKQYDKFNELDEQRKEAKEKEKVSPWKNEVDRLNNVDQEFEKAKKIRKNRKSSTNIQ